MRAIVLCCLMGLMSTYTLAKELTIAFPMELPPWTFQKGSRGITVEVVRESLKIAGHTITPKYLSLAMLNQPVGEQFDGHAQVESPNLKGHYSEKVMIFQTSLISLEKNQYQIRSMNDLDNKRIIAFENAHFLFGKEFETYAKNHPQYKEISNQEEQVAMLYQGQADIILIDKNIFLYYRRVTSLVDTSEPHIFNFVDGLTEPSPAYVVFHDSNLRDDFNFGLKKLKENRQYYSIFSKYVR